MQFIGNKIWIICAQVLLGLLWLCLLVQITTIVSYRHCFTAGELLAWIVANSYESGDIIHYCMRYVWPYWLGCTLLFGVGCWWLWTQATKTPKYRYWTITILIVLLLPFVIPGQPCCLAREVVCVVKQLRNIRLHRDDATDFVYQAKKNAIFLKKTFNCLPISLKKSNFAGRLLSARPAGSRYLRSLSLLQYAI
mgnify:CR=1 FL=1